MIDTLLRHKLILIILVLFVAGAAWYGMMGSSAPSPSLTSDTLVASGPDQALIETLLALRAVKLDGAILTEPIFMGLQDFSTAIVPEPVGRPNPFAPLGASAAPNASTTKSAQIFNAGKAGAKPPGY